MAPREDLHKDTPICGVSGVHIKEGRRKSKNVKILKRSECSLGIHYHQIPCGRPGTHVMKCPFSYQDIDDSIKTREPAKKTTKEPAKKTTKEPAKKTTKEPAKKTTREPAKKTKEPARPVPSTPCQPPALKVVQKKTAEPRLIVIDGSNVAMSHGKHEEFSTRGLKICIDYFQARGHAVKAFVGGNRRYRSQRKRHPTRDRDLLMDLEEQGLVQFTPLNTYDDRFVLDLAHEKNGVVVSNDRFRDLMFEKPHYKDLIQNRVLQFLFVDDLFMPPDDPLGRYGPNLDEFLGSYPGN